MDLATFSKRNATRWAVAKLTRDAHEAARLIVQPAAKVRYQLIAQETAVPWFIIGLIHYREAGLSWSANLAQGDPWDRVSIHVPKDRGPFKSFQDAAVDALTNCPPHASKWKDWSAGGALTLLELYNGIGYFDRSLPSPYIWAGTDQYVKGKFVADGVFNPDAVDKQLGCACILKTMMQMDSSITFTGAILTKVPAPKPPLDHPQPSFLAMLLAALLSIFRGRK